jgi:hypothetical protein
LVDAQAARLAHRRAGVARGDHLHVEHDLGDQRAAPEHLVTELRRGDRAGGAAQETAPLCASSRPTLRLTAELVRPERRAASEKLRGSITLANTTISCKYPCHPGPLLNGVHYGGCARSVGSPMKHWERLVRPV